jgi:chromodomain-helicase-DNA-binding protein 7
LISQDIEYQVQLQEFIVRRQKPTKTSIIKGLSIHNQIKTKCWKLFADKSTKSNENMKGFMKKLQLHPFPNDCKLRDYQAEGVTWLLANYINGRNSVLADEMGLGKTIQTAVFINMLNKMLNIRGPFLVIAPLSTLTQWKREFSSWTGMNTIVYHGSSKDREYIREYEFAYEVDRPPFLNANALFLSHCHELSSPKWQRTWMVQVVLTTPEVLCSDDSTELAILEWEALIVDEAHRLKNHSSKFGTSLRDERFTFKHTLLLTGTPIQNNMHELWTLMNLIDPRRFPNCEKFMMDYGDMKTKEKVDELHETIRPYILRRLKEDVEKSVPLKEETLIEVELTVLQKQYYRALYEKNVQFLQRNSSKAMEVGPSLSNIAMQLRKCCNHPFLLEGVEGEARDSVGGGLSDNRKEADFLVQASGKLVLLDKLLPKLKDGGHRVLIFSQFKIMLDILEDYLRLRNFKAERIDGSITGRERQKAIDRFQAQGSMESSFVMLLTTRAGGVGMCLAVGHVHCSFYLYYTVYHA